MAAGFGFSDLSGYVSVQYPYASLFATPEDFPQYVPASILAPASPDLAYLYDIFEDTSGVQPSQESEIVLNPSLPHYNPAPSSFSPQIASPVSDAARASTTYSVPIPSSPPAPGPSQTVMGYPSNRRKIPQTVYGLGKKRRDYQPSEPILFHVNGRPGVNMGDALRKEFAGLDGRDDLMFQGGVNAFSCRLMFPGYPANSQLQIFTKRWNKERTPIARSALAHYIARKVKHYLDMMASSHSIDDSTDKQWEIGKRFMTLDNMFLVRLEHLAKGSYQPELWVAM